MITNRKLWLIAAVAALAACDPYAKENTGALEILSVFAGGGSNDFGGPQDIVQGTATTPTTYTVTGATAGNVVFFVKTNKLLDGSKIQASPSSCVPAPEVALTVNGAPAVDWFSCYVPSTGTASEGSSVVLYHGTDIQGLTTYMESASIDAGTYTIVATITDKQGNQQTVTIDATVVPAPAA